MLIIFILFFFHNGLFSCLGLLLRSNSLGQYLKTLYFLLQLSWNFSQWRIFFLLFSGNTQELIMRMAVQGSLSVGIKWSDFNYTSNQSELEYSYRAVCNEHYYGPHCTKICRPRNDEFGHYTCLNDGSIKCLPGWKGQYCQERKHCFPCNFFEFSILLAINWLGNNLRWCICQHVIGILQMF